MAERKKPTRRKRLSRKEAHTAEHAGAVRNSGTAQHSTRPRPSVNDNRHGLRRRRSETAKEKAARKARAAVHENAKKQADEPAGVAASTEVVTPATGESAAVQRQAAVQDKAPVNVTAASTENDAAKAANPQNVAPAIETKIPSLAPLYASAVDVTGASGDGQAPSSSAGSEAFAPSVEGPTDFSDNAMYEAPADFPAPSDAGASATAAAKAQGTVVEPATAPTPTTESQSADAGSASQTVVSGETAAGEAEAEADTAVASADTASEGKKRRSFSGKRATGPDIVDHVKERARRRRHRRKALAIILVIVAILALVGGLFAWQRWFRYDDAADIQGTWQLNANKKQSVVIDDTHIDLIKGLAYTYSLDTTDKTISFTFNGETGTGTYHFDADRDVLVIREGGEPANILVQLGLQEDPAIQDDTMNDDVTVLTRVSSDTTAYYKGSKILSSSTKASSSSSTTSSSDSSDTESTASSDSSSSSDE